MTKITKKIQNEIEYFLLNLYGKKDFSIKQIQTESNDIHTKTIKIIGIPIEYLVSNKTILYKIK